MELHNGLNNFHKKGVLALFIFFNTDEQLQSLVFSKFQANLITE